MQTLPKLTEFYASTKGYYGFPYPDETEVWVNPFEYLQVTPARDFWASGWSAYELESEVAIKMKLPSKFIWVRNEK